MHTNAVLAQRGWQSVIGLETHVQLNTRSKIFSPAATAFGGEPNTQVHWVDAALPGVLPVANKTAIEHAIRFGLAIGAQIRRHSIFARKHYFYPDLPKAYQISQYEEPIVEHGTLSICTTNINGSGHKDKVVTILRAHLEEDAGKLVHDQYPQQSAIDLNRAGTPLIEVVTTPCLDNAEEALVYARALHHLVVWLGICDGNMQEGSFRCDANVSVKRLDSPTLGTRCEIKNLNSFRFLEKAINYEIERQIEVLESGGTIIQETRLYDPERDETRAMRSKEDAHDYRYFPDPDLLPIVVGDDDINALRDSLPPLPHILKERMMNEMALTEDIAETMLSSRDKAQYFLAINDKVTRSLPADKPQSADKIAKAVVNWINGAVANWANEAGLTFSALSQKAFADEALATLIARVLAGEINHQSAKTLWAQWYKSPESAIRGTAVWVDECIDSQGFRNITQSDDDWLEPINRAIEANPKAVEEYRAGKAKALMSLVGAVMKASGGKAPADKIKTMLMQKLQ